MAPGSPYRARIGVDGFWIDAPPDANEGDEVEYDAQVQGRSVTGRARLTMSPRGTFVYTGASPSEVVVTEVFGAIQTTSRSYGSSYTDDRQNQFSSGSSSGWPSAY
jgi:hypothetical protein